MAENCWCDKDLRKCGESYPSFVEVLEPCAGTRNWFQRESYPLFVEVLELGDSGGRGEFCESYLLFVVVLELS